MYKKKVFFFLLLLICTFCLGCANSKTKGNDRINPIKAIKTELKLGSTVRRVNKWEKTMVRPALDVYDSYIKKYALRSKAEKLPETEIRKSLMLEANAALVKLKSIKAEIDSYDSMKITDEYLYYSRLFIDRAIKRVELANAISNENDTNKRNRYMREGWQLERKLIWEARYGHDNAISWILKHKGTYNINSYTATRFRKGYTYEQIMHILRMPGEELPTINVKGPKGIERHQQVIWIHNNQIIYVEFVNSRAYSWKVVRSNNGFLNSK